MHCSESLFSARIRTDPASWCIHGSESSENKKPLERASCSRITGKNAPIKTNQLSCWIIRESEGVRTDCYDGVHLGRNRICIPAAKFAGCSSAYVFTFVSRLATDGRVIVVVFE
jgi:hypothetical protein